MKPLYLLPLLALSSPAVAQTSKDYLAMGEKAYSVWSCSILAAYMGNHPETERLINLGYSLGKTYLEAANTGKISKADVIDYPSVMFAELIPGPTPDFKLGRMYEAAIRDTVKEANAVKEATTAEARKAKANDMYRKQNCSFLK